MRSGRSFKRPSPAGTRSSSRPRRRATTPSPTGSSPAPFSFLTEHDGQILGAYVVKPNQPGLGAHVANAAYTVAPTARRLGIGRALGEHSLREAKRRGYRAMQFNAVVATNEPAVRLWTGLGFQIVGTLPGAFHHRRLGFVDLLVMFRSLDDIP
ncbi:MAG: GNAT family N-acetyltransferase [Gemmataceae bacterium]|nr:GNAT family N-acetyltransferase [Gemmataceae bacterium]